MPSMPRRLRIAVTTLSFACDTWLQHWTGPVLQLPLSPEGVPEGVARFATSTEDFIWSTVMFV